MSGKGMPFQYTIHAFNTSMVSFGTHDGSTSHASHSLNDFLEMMMVPEQQTHMTFSPQQPLANVVQAPRMIVDINIEHG
ncbi:hypothetical protein JCGZ_08555 [Jatropha curcas]|uniref:Uncharacterized protein n=1 Tax=Jatropha curcas TaxID=180498 RepID=A0A067LGV6_JATCU|nr:hypothetical protein JCGZ_08555 [Jatropha curcas]